MTDWLTSYAGVIAIAAVVVAVVACALLAEANHRLDQVETQRDRWRRYANGLERENDDLRDRVRRQAPVVALPPRGRSS